MAQTVRRGPGDRAGLDRERILAAARRLPPEELTMQAVADLLGVTRKALSHHVTDRETLFGLVAMETFAARFAETRVDPASPWRELCRDYAVAVVAGALAAGPLVDRVRLDSSGGAALETTNAVIGCLVGAGLDEEEAVRAVVLLTDVALAHARDLASATHGDRERPALLRAALRASEEPYPLLERILTAAPDTYGPEQLDFAIAVVLDGLERRLIRAG